MASPGVTGVSFRHSTDLADHTRLVDYVRRCVAVLGGELTAYLAGAGSAAELEGWLTGQDLAGQGLAGQDGVAWLRAVPRLAVAVEVIQIFAAENLLSLARHWLREIGPDGEPAPARSIRAAGDDAHMAKRVVQAATYWVSERRAQLASA